MKAIHVNFLLLLIATFIIAAFVVHPVKAEDETFKDNDYNARVSDDDEPTQRNKSKGAVPQNMFLLATAAASKVIKHLNQLQHQLIEWVVNIVLPKAFGIHIPKYQVQEVINFIKNWTWNKLKTTGLLDEYLWILDTLTLFQDNSIAQ